MNKTETLSHYWWLGIIQGVLLLLIGWFLLSSPALTTLALVEILGLYWLIAGALDVILAIFNKGGEKNRGLELAGGVIGILVGLIILNNPVISAVFGASLLVYLIAFSFLFSGAIKMFVGSASQNNSKFRWSWGSLSIGILYVILGLMLLGGPMLAEIAAIVMVMGFAAVIGGILTIVASFALKDA